jgi:hypothetical protein
LAVVGSRGLQTIVNCAGIVQVKLLTGGRRPAGPVMDINVKSIYLSIKHGIGTEEKSSQHVVNIGFDWKFHLPSSTPIQAKECPHLMLSKSIALDFAADGVR